MWVIIIKQQQEQQEDMQSQGQQKQKAPQTNLQRRIGIKNPHLVHSLHIHNNSQLFIVYHTSIHIHSLSQIFSFLPSLIHIIELSQLAKRIENEEYQDELTGKIIGTKKSGFGEVVFGEGLDTTSNVLLGVKGFGDRLRYLGGEFVRVRAVEVHPCGHLLVCFQDRRCVLIKRTNPFSLSQSTHTLYNVAQAIPLNKIVKNGIIYATLANSQEINIFCFHHNTNPKSDITINNNNNNNSSTISRINFDEKDNSIKVYIVPQNKKNEIQEKGFIKMVCIGQLYGSSGFYLLLLYYNRVELIEIGKFNNKNKTYQVLSHKEAQFTQELESQHVINSWQYSFFPKNQRQSKLYLSTSASIWQLQLNFNPNPKDNLPWNYSLTKKADLPTKSHIYYINFQGDSYEHTSPLGSQPNYMANFVTETDNGVMVRLGASEGNYREGFVSVGCPAVGYVLRKAMHCVEAKEKGDKLWVSFADIAWLNKYPTLKKQLLRQLGQLKKQKPTPSPTLSPQSLQTLTLNFFSALQSHPQKVALIIQQKLQQKHKELYNPRHCAFTNKKIYNEELVYCERCQLYSIREMVRDGCCFLCWNVLYFVD